MTRDAPTTLNYFTAPPSRRARFVAWVVCMTALLVTTTCWLFALRGERILKSDLILASGWITLGGGIVIIAILLKTTPADALRLSRRASYWMILGGALLLQVVATILLSPALSEDVLRYRLDGQMWLNGVSPYGTTPNVVRRDSFRRSAGLDAEGLRTFDFIDQLAPHQHVHTIYPPTAQLVFVGTRWIENALWREQGWTSPYPPWRWIVSKLPRLQQALVQRIAVSAFAVAAVATLLSVLHTSARSAWYAVLLAWNPLFVIETGGMGHVDVVGVLLVLLTIRALQSRHAFLAAAMLALAAGVKPHAVLLAPFLLRDVGAAGSHVNPGRLAAVFLSFLALVYSPMLVQGGYKGWFRTSHIYATSWEANGSIHELIKRSADASYSDDPAVKYWSGIENGVRVQRAKDRARLLAGAAVVVTMLLAWFGRADLVTAGYWVFLVALLFSPVVYPWYLLWVLCFVPLLRGWQGMTALVWAATAGVSYLLWRTSDWVLPMRWLLVEYLPVYATLVAEVAWVLGSRPGRHQPIGVAPHTFS